MAYEEKEAKKKIIEAAERMLVEGLTSGNLGSVSARISPESFVITPGFDMDHLTPDDIVTLSVNDDFSRKRDIRLAEAAVHAVAYRTRPGEDFILYTHQANASAIGILGQDVKHISGYMDGADVILGPVVCCAPYNKDPMGKTADQVEKALKRQTNSAAVLLQNRGALCIGSDDKSAFSVARTLEQVADFRYREMVKEANEIDLPIQKRREKLRTFYTVFERESDVDYERRSAIYDLKEVNCIIYSHTPYVKKMGLYKSERKSYIEDQTYLIGYNLICLPGDCRFSQIAKALKNSRAVLIEGVGAVCIGQNRREAETVCEVLEKGAQAALLGQVKHAAPLSDSALRYIQRANRRRSSWKN